MAGLGQAGAAGQAASGNQMVNSYGNAMGQIGSAQAAGSMGQGNAINSGLGQAANSYMNYNMMNTLMNRPSTGFNPTVGNDSQEAPSGAVTGQVSY
jgi:hypothetical protein